MKLSIRTAAPMIILLALSGCQTAATGSNYDQAELNAAKDAYMECGGTASARASKLPGDPLAKADAVVAFCEPEIVKVQAALSGESRSFRDGYISAMKKSLRSQAAGSMLGMLDG